MNISTDYFYNYIGISYKIGSIHRITSIDKTRESTTLSMVVGLKLVLLSCLNVLNFSLKLHLMLDIKEDFLRMCTWFVRILKDVYAIRNINNPIFYFK